MKKAGWLMSMAIGIALLGGLTSIARADVKCPPGHEDECGARKSYYCICIPGPTYVYMGNKCWCGEGQSCYPCVPIPDCNAVCGGGSGMGIFLPPW